MAVIFPLLRGCDACVDKARKAQEPVGGGRVLAMIREATAPSRAQTPLQSTKKNAMTAQQYLLNQAEHCRRAAQDSSDAFIAEELLRLAKEFERKARAPQSESTDCDVAA